MHGFYTTKDIPGRNNFVPSKHRFFQIVEDEEIFVSIDSRILYYGQPCGMILANSMALANYAATQVKITYKKVKDKEPLQTGNLLSVIDNVNEQANSNQQQGITFKNVLYTSISSYL